MYVHNKKNNAFIVHKAFKMRHTYQEGEDPEKSFFMLEAIV